MTQSIQVLIVEDNAQLAESIRTFFAQRDFIEVVGIASNALEAIELLKTTHPGIIILDLVMPKSDGFVLLEHLNASTVEKKPEVIVLSAISNEAIIRRTCELGAIYYIIKPFSVEDLYDRVRNIAGFYSNTKVETASPKIDDPIDQRISKVLINLGVLTQNKGFKYICKAIILILKKPELIYNITKELYPLIGEAYQTNPVNVERAIRHAIEVAWDSGRLLHLNQYFNSSTLALTSKPSNGEFLSLLVDLLNS